jgi:hypothetical protein
MDFVISARPHSGFHMREESFQAPQRPEIIENESAARCGGYSSGA